jgi:acyl-CoA synthetase (AMP-forming)/AMP-acid ligase II
MTSLSYRAPLAPSGPELIQWLAGEPGVRDNGLSDGRLTVPYSEMPGVFERLDRLFARHGVTKSHPLALEVSQSVAGALSILYSLSRGYDVVVLPELSGASMEAGTARFIPAFCSHVITTLPIGDEPEDGFTVAANEAFAVDPVVAEFQGPDVYMRSSGTTGVPKLIRKSHQKWLNNSFACTERWRHTPDDRIAIPVPIFHSYGFGAGFMGSVLSGGSIDLGGGSNIVRYLESEERFKPTVGIFAPALCDGFVGVRKSSRPYRLAVAAGDRLKRETIAAYEPRFGALINLYGITEMGAVCSASPDDSFDLRLPTAGYAHTGVDVRIDESGADPDSGEGVGLLQCRQKNGYSGYLIPEGQDWRFAPHGDDDWFETGDMAKLRDDGYIEIIGRSKHSAKRDGLLVVFAEVESAVEQVEGIQRAILVPAGENRRGTRLVAVCLADSNGNGLRPDDVRKQCSSLLPRYAVPDEVVILAELPELPSGKVDRRALQDLVMSR